MVSYMRDLLSPIFKDVGCKDSDFSLRVEVSAYTSIFDGVAACIPDNDVPFVPIFFDVWVIGYSQGSHYWGMGDIEFYVHRVVS